MSKTSKDTRSKHSKGTGFSTPATLQLQKLGIDFQIYEYDHGPDHMDEGYGLEAAEKLHLDPGQVFKTLVADTGAERVVAVVPASAQVSMKSLAQALGIKKVVLADPAIAQKESGYVLGGISPLGQRSVHRTIIDSSALKFDQILVSGGKRGFDVGLDAHDLAKLLDASFESIGKPTR